MTVKKVFISYSWDSESHKAWVLMLAEHLEREPGLSIQLDRWHIQAGDSLAKFMEQIASADCCVVICTPAYAAKANQRIAGAGYEAQIMAALELSKTPGHTVVPLIREGEFTTALPTFLSGRHSIDFRKAETFRGSLEDLLRALLERPRYIPPAKDAPTVLLPSPHSDRVTTPMLAAMPVTRVDVQNATDWHLPTADQPGRLNITTHVTGPNPITDLVVSGQITSSAVELDRKEIDGFMDKQLLLNDESTMRFDGLFHNRILIVPVDLQQGRMDVVQDMLQGKSRLYLFLCMSYKDVIAAPQKTITTEYCVYYENGLLPPFFCQSRNRVYYRRT